jgi:hypothetical protein
MKNYDWVILKLGSRCVVALVDCVDRSMCSKQCKFYTRPGARSYCGLDDFGPWVIVREFKRSALCLSSQVADASTTYRKYPPKALAVMRFGE